MTNTIPLLIDTDPGVDDALALLMAFNDTRHDIVGLTVTAGNVGLQHTVRNALKLCEVAGRHDIPVHAGSASPLLHPSPDAGYVHGRDGFGDVGHPPPRREAEAEHAALAILRLSREHAGRLLLVALGPLTNIALALKLDPTLPQRIARLVIMGGAVSSHGNITPAAEFNIHFDPEAAHIVVEAFPRFDLVDWEAVLVHGLQQREVDSWLSVDSPRARFYDMISRQTRAWSAERRGERWHSADALAMAHALHPDAATQMLERPVAVELAGRLTRGATLVDWLRQGGQPDNAAILMAYDQDRFQTLIREALAAR
ncbi:purine nucleosidase [Luteimonas cucumeris]|uniref:Purine nucleosidase n=1 Tax=Luteimonas cucumeris TaxID=985012 RepID=A0A562LF14_9GAMM|nr:nucleoside hydrolase [Luteimonas cucumeris]TWI06198.1 purine nucleosidase [Luteimonas cucumeris]